MSDPVLLDRKGAVATLTLNRPKALNALDLGMSRGLRQALAEVEADDGVRVVVVRGAGDHFMAGGDLRWFHEHLGMPADERRRIFEGFIAQEVHPSVVMLRRMAKPVVASVHGAVAGFGMSLMMACDLAVAADNAYFTLAYSLIGTTPDGGSTFALPRLVGAKRAMEIALLADRFDASRAEALGLVNRVVPAADLQAETERLAARLAAGPTAAYGRTKALLNGSLQVPLEAQLQREAEAFAAASTTADFAEGIDAFLGKRKPTFGGA